MNGKKAQIRRPYPQTVTLEGGKTVSLRLMTGDDAGKVTAFAQALPPDDLLFLRTDITRPDAVREWVQNIEAGSTITVLADAEGGLGGYASLHYHELTWQRHLGEIRIQVAAAYRSVGLGRRLASEIFAIAQDLGLQKLQARMTPDQKGAVATFERLGFQPEAVLQDFVMDRDGRTRDLVIMTCDVGD